MRILAPFVVGSVVQQDAINAESQPSAFAPRKRSADQRPAIDDQATFAAGIGWMAWKETHSRFQVLIMLVATVSLTNSSSEKCFNVAS